ncbi:MAG: response regulator [Myxococcales bacterium]|nr:response regulator [Myxococcales bacterium]
MRQDLSDSTSLDPRPRVMVVDDDGVLAGAASMLLVSLGYRVKTHTEPKAALAELESDAGSYDALLTDYAMPSLSGIELARRAAAVRPGLAIVLVTGYDRGPCEQCATIDAVLRKPYRLAELERVMSSALEQRQVGSVAE